MSYDLSNPPVSYDLPVNADGTCMKCKWAPPEPETIPCHTCATPWHVSCLSSPPETVASTLDWLCPDCSGLVTGVTGGGGRDVSVVVSGGSDDLVAKVRAIEADETMDAKEKARRRQELVSGRAHDSEEEEQDKEKDEEGGEKKEKDVLELLGGSFNCRICFQLPERPITTPCGHNYCLKCFQKWAKESRTCVICRAEIPSKISANPRINSALVTAIRMAKCAKLTSSGSGQVYHFMRNDTRPEKAFTTDRAKRAGKANACSGQIFVTVAPDHFGPIPAENDPKRNRGVLVGDLWEDRLECRQWGAHLPHVAGIAGQSDYGAQSVALSGGYEDDEDHGEWFLYTGSGGRDLSGNKRTNKAQSFDQKFEKLNLALRLSCMKGYPVRVVRSFKEKRSAYAPETGVRYDGVYRIEKCWRKAGIQGYKVCRYLFVRCDNEPAPWTSDEHGDRPRRLPVIGELEGATDVTERTDSPSWDYDEEKGWMWMKPPPKSKKPVRIEDPSEQKETKKAIRLAQNTSVMERLLKEFNCRLCRQVMSLPLSAPCGHNFCKQCLLGSYADQSFVRERVSAGGRTLRAQKIVKNCPVCPTDITEFLKNPQINREIMELIESLKRKCEEGKELYKKRGDDQEDLTEDEIKTEGKPDELNEKKVETLEGDSIRKTSKRAREENALSSPKRTKKEADEKMIDEAVVADTAYSPLSPLSVPVAQDIQVV